MIRIWHVILTVSVLLLNAILLESCTDASWERNTAYGNRHRVTMYSGGIKVAEYVSTGAPRSVAEEDGWQFVDESTDHLITVTGDCVIEKLP